MPFGNPILAGTVLARTAMQSEDYVAGVSGWAIFRDGSAEFNNGTYRGRLDITSPDGASVQIDNLPGGAITLFPPSATPPRSFDPASLQASGTDDPVLTGSGSLTIIGVGYDDGAGNAYLAPVLVMDSARPSGALGRFRFIRGDVVVEDPYTMKIGVYEVFRGQSGIALVTFAAATSNSTAVVFPTAFPAGVTPVVTLQIVTGNGNATRWNVRPINITNTGFTIFSTRTDAADPAIAWTNIPIQWTATMP